MLLYGVFFFTEDILTCHRRESAAVDGEMNEWLNCVELLQSRGPAVVRTVTQSRLTGEVGQAVAIDSVTCSTCLVSTMASQHV